MRYTQRGHQNVRASQELCTRPWTGQGKVCWRRTLITMSLKYVATQRQLSIAAWSAVMTDSIQRVVFVHLSPPDHVHARLKGALVFYGIT